MKKYLLSIFALLIAECGTYQPEQTYDSCPVMTTTDMRTRGSL